MDLKIWYQLREVWVNPKPQKVFIKNFSPLAPYFYLVALVALFLIICWLFGKENQYAVAECMRIAKNTSLCH